MIRYSLNLFYKIDLRMQAVISFVDHRPVSIHIAFATPMPFVKPVLQVKSHLLRTVLLHVFDSLAFGIPWVHFISVKQNEGKLYPYKNY